MDLLTIVGAGLAGSEAAFQLAFRGIPVTLLEMRPDVSTGAHRSGNAAEIVCSNSFKSTLPETASGLLKMEMEILGAVLLNHAKASRIAAGHALAVDRDLFSESVTRSLEENTRIDMIRRCQESLDLSLPAIVATGPLTAETFAGALRQHCSKEHLFFYDAIAPSIDGNSVDFDKAFWASRYEKGDADYVNIPLTEADYSRMLEKIRNAELTDPHPFEEQKFFEACLPVEEMAKRGIHTLRFGPLKPKGLIDPRTGKEPFAVVQLRRESREGNLLGLVGFQTRMKRPFQRALIRSIPALEEAEILRYGAIHKNLYLDFPRISLPYQRDRKTDGLFYAGQICGVEGYSECILSGLISALAVVARFKKRELPDFPESTMTGALMRYIHTPSSHFQPMNANMGLLPPVNGPRRRKKERYLAYSERAAAAMQAYRENHSWLFES